MTISGKYTSSRIGYNTVQGRHTHKTREEKGSNERTNKSKLTLKHIFKSSNESFIKTPGIKISCYDL